jgi:ABC-type nickel/cobalt efflux system permease component RcnA
MAKPEHEPMAAGKAVAVMFGAWTAVLWILAKMGFYTGMATTLASCHLFFNLTALGLIIGTAESLVYGFLAGYIFAWLYNKM